MDKITPYVLVLLVVLFVGYFFFLKINHQDLYLLKMKEDYM